MPSIRAQDRILGLLLFSSLVAHTLIVKLPDRIPELLYGCSVFSILMVIGLLLKVRLLVGMSYVFYVGVGLPAWILQIIATQTTTPTSMLFHVLTPVCGYLFYRRATLSRWTLIGAITVVLSLIPLSYFLTPPHFNVNVVHAPWPLLAGAFSSQIGFLAFSTAGVIALLFLAFLALRRIHPNNVGIAS